MTQKDYIGPVKKISQHLVFDQKDFYRVLDGLFNNLGYRYLETGYNEKQFANGAKKLSFIWSGERKVSVYLKLAIDLEYSSNVKDIVVEKDDKKLSLQEGDVSIGISGYLKKDIRDEWGIRHQSGTMKFLREAYDKILGKDKMGSHEAQLKKDVEKLIRDLKTYFKLTRYD